MVALGVLLSYFTNYGVNKHIPQDDPRIHRIPFGLQLVPSGLMAIGLIFVKESPRWLARKGKREQSLRNLAFLRRRAINDHEVIEEFAEIEASVKEEIEGRLSLFGALKQKGTPMRFLIAFGLFVFQQWAGQNAVNYFGEPLKAIVALLPALCSHITPPIEQGHKFSSRSATPARLLLCWQQACTALSNLLLRSSVSISVSSDSVDDGLCSARQRVWASCSTPLVPFSRYTRPTQRP